MNNKKEIALFIYPTYKCLNKCSFCFIDSKFKNNSNLTLKEIEKNIIFFKNKYLVKELTLTGGEPLFYKNIISVIDLFYNKYFYQLGTEVFVIASDVLRCYSSDFVNHLISFFNLNSNIYSCFHISLNNFHSRDRFFKERKQAIINLAKNKLNLRFIIVFAKDGINEIKKNINFLNNIFLKYYSNSTSRNFIIELRIPFNVRDARNSEKFILSSDYFIKEFQSICNLFLKKQIPFALRNIPLCYSGIKESKTLKMFYKESDVTKTVIRVDKDNQFDRAIIKKYTNNRWSLQKECNDCYLKNECNGIDLTYINKFKYPQLKPFN